MFKKRPLQEIFFKIDEIKDFIATEKPEITENVLKPKNAAFPVFLKHQVERKTIDYFIKF